MTEIIISAALQHKETGLIISLPRPHRHHNIMHLQYDIVHESIGGKYEQGFLTSAGRFVDREEGCILAKLHDQIIKKHGPDTILFSEDMW